MENMIKALGRMSLEELLEIYKGAEALLGKDGASMIELLIAAEIDKRIDQGRDKDTERLYDLYVKGIIDKEKLKEKLRKFNN